MSVILDHVGTQQVASRSHHLVPICSRHAPRAVVEATNFAALSIGRSRSLLPLRHTECAYYKAFLERSPGSG